MNGCTPCKPVAIRMSTSPKAPNIRWGNLFALHKVYCAMLPAAAVASASAPTMSKYTDKLIIATKLARGPETCCKRLSFQMNNMSQGAYPATNPVQNPFREKRRGLGGGGFPLMKRHVLLMTPQTNANGTLSSSAAVISLVAMKEMMNQHKNPSTNPSKNL